MHYVDYRKGMLIAANVGNGIAYQFTRAVISPEAAIFGVVVVSSIALAVWAGLMFADAYHLRRAR